MRAPKIVIQTYRNIDQIRSVSEMRMRVSQLPINLRAKVIEYALNNSRFQFTWSWLAEKCL